MSALRNPCFKLEFGSLSRCVPAPSPDSDDSAALTSANPLPEFREEKPGMILTINGLSAGSDAQTMAKFISIPDQ
ncbi:hypothetical protein CFE70_007823 [Pyrenophora teres f. teres 0-1]